MGLTSKEEVRTCLGEIKQKEDELEEWIAASSSLFEDEEDSVDVGSSGDESD